jgi:nicotinate-nucleotide adenylyltransferase
MTEQAEKIGIMGGTFDPIHFGHLLPAETALEVFSLNKVLFIPSGQPPHKGDRRVSPSEHRYAMTLLATEDNPRFEVSRVELDRGGLSFTVDTLQTLRESYGCATEFYFITGVDAITEIFLWKSWKSLFDLCHFVVAERPGYDLKEFFRQVRTYGDDFYSKVGERVHAMPCPLLEISSTDIRRRVAGGSSVRYLVPRAVADYISKTGLYLP